MNEPLISVIMSVYKEKMDWIKQSVISIIKQSYPNIEIVIVIDNPEYHEAIKYLKELEVKNSNIIIIINETNIGLAMSMNKAAEISSGVYLARMDADDIAVNGRLECTLKEIVKTNSDMVSSNCILFEHSIECQSYKSDIPETFETIKKTLPISNSIIHPTVIMKKNVFNELGGYRDFDVAQDYDLWLRFLSNGYKISSLNEKLIYYRISSPSNNNIKKFKQQLTDEFEKNLYKERLSNGKDTFSKQQLISYYEKNGLFDKQVVDNYNKYYKKFDVGIAKIKKHMYFNGILEVVKSIIFNKFIRKRVFQTIRYKLAKGVK